jgi:hypothetical protein
MISKRKGGKKGAVPIRLYGGGGGESEGLGLRKK